MKKANRLGEKKKTDKKGRKEGKNRSKVVTKVRKKALTYPVRSSKVPLGVHVPPFEKHGTSRSLKR